MWWAAGMFAANGLLTARARALDTGAGELLDVSMLEAAILTQTMYQVTYRTIAGRPMRSYCTLPFVLVVDPQIITLVPTFASSSFKTMAFVFRPAKKSTPWFC